MVAVDVGPWAASPPTRSFSFDLSRGEKNYFFPFTPLFGSSHTVFTSILPGHTSYTLPLTWLPSELGLALPRRRRARFHLTCRGERRIILRHFDTRLGARTQCSPLSCPGILRTLCL